MDRWIDSPLSLESCIPVHIWILRILSNSIPPSRTPGLRGSVTYFNIDVNDGV